MIQLANNTEKLNFLVNEIIQSKGLDENIKSYQQSHNKIDIAIKGLLNEFKENLQRQQNLVKPEFDKKLLTKGLLNFIKNEMNCYPQ